MRRIHIMILGLAISTLSCGRTVPAGQNVPAKQNVAIPEAQRQFGSMVDGFFSDIDKAQAAADAKATDAAAARIFDPYKALSNEAKQAVHWVGRCLTPADYSKETSGISHQKVQAGLLLADAGRVSDDRIIFALTDADPAQCHPGQLAQFDGTIAHLKVEFLAPMEGKLLEASASTRGEVWFDTMDWKPLGISKARVIVEIANGRVSPYPIPLSSPPAR